jgi:GT2 family glycosyltransferase
MTASVIVPLFNRYDLTVGCLDALITEPDFELVLIDNGSTDATSQLDVTIRNRDNLGFAKACNQGAAEATGDILVFLNNDTVPHTGWLTALKHQLESCDIAGAKLLNPDGTLQHAGITVDFSRPPGSEARDIDYDLNMGPYPVDAVTGACLAIHAAAFTGFDDGYWNGYEDVDLCLQVKADGGTIWYTPDAVVTHIKHASGPERWTAVRQNIQRLRDKWGERE